MTASTPIRANPRTSVRQLVSPRFEPTPQSFPSVLSSLTEIPNRRGTWLAIRITATPFMNPTSTGLERKSARKPSRSTPPRIIITPISSASMAARDAYFDVWPAASGASAEAVRIARPDSGPTISRRELANSG